MGKLRPFGKPIRFVLGRKKGAERAGWMDNYPLQRIDLSASVFCPKQFTSPCRSLHLVEGGLGGQTDVAR